MNKPRVPTHELLDGSMLKWLEDGRVLVLCSGCKGFGRGDIIFVNVSAMTVTHR